MGLPVMVKNVCQHVDCLGSIDIEIEDISQCDLEMVIWICLHMTHKVDKLCIGDGKSEHFPKCQTV